MHCCNAAERAIQTFKDHFKAALCGCDPRFPLCYWCFLIPQSVLTLNLLRTSRLKPKHSTSACLNGSYDYNANPIAPLGTHIVMHQKPSQRATWAPVGIDGWHAGPNFECYHCCTCAKWCTNKVVHPNTMAWFPHQVPMSTSTSNEILSQAINDLAGALERHDPSTSFPPNESFFSPTLSHLNDIFLAPPAAPSSEPKSDSSSKPVSPAPLLRVPNPPADEATTPQTSNCLPLPFPSPTPQPPAPPGQHGPTIRGLYPGGLRSFWRPPGPCSHHP